MKTEYLFVILLVLIGFSSCEDSTSDATLELSQSTFENISSDGATLTVNITSSDSWTAASSSTACNLVPNQGTSNQSLSIVVEANLVNVMVYNFKDDESTNSTTLGIAHIPFSTVGSNYLEGLSKTQKSYLEKQNLKFPYSVSINSLFINDQSTSTQYSTADITVTLAHELGHYLGLHHAFSENDEGIYDGCFDSDYCDDTPTYNKVEYDADYAYTAKNDPANFTFDYLVKRKNCKTNQTFTSTNIMDYSVSYSDRFTNDQRSRIRHVLTYSPLIPGPKQGQTQTRSVVEGPIDLPIRTAR